MIHAKLGAKEFDMPSSWEEITVKQFMDLTKDEAINSVTMQMAILTGLSKQEILSANSIHLERNILPHTEFINTIPDLERIKKEIPKTIRIGEKVLPVIKHLELEPWGCKETLYMEMIKAYKADGHLNNLLAVAIATYFYQVYYGKDFDSEKLDEFVKTTEQCSFIEAFPVANFFLNKSKNLLLTSRQSLKQNTTPMNQRQESVN